MHFTHECVDCGEKRQIEPDQPRVHDCPMPERLRGRVARAWAEGYEFGCKEEAVNVL